MTVNDKLSAVIIPRDQHIISRKMMSKGALKVLYTLKDAGFSAYLVGGGVRDLLLGRTPKDFDIATDAHPEQIKQLFRSCYLVGRRFRIAHVRIRGEVFEVSTFRADHETQHVGAQSSADGLILRDNVYGDISQDAWRRDFSVNALYYNIADFSIVDYSGGMADIDKRVLRVIGDPEQRYREDPVRMLRALRLAAKLDFNLDTQAEQPLQSLRELLLQVSSSRLYLEVEKLFLSGHALQGYELLLRHQMFALLFPQAAALVTTEREEVSALLRLTLANTDERIRIGKYITPAFLLAALLWYPLEDSMREIREAGDESAYQAFEIATDKILSAQAQRLAIPKRLTVRMREIWYLQIQLQARIGKRPLHVLQHQRFRAGYDFLLLRAEVEPVYANLAQWWTDFQEEAPEQRLEMLKVLQKTQGKKRRRRKKS